MHEDALGLSACISDLLTVHSFSAADGVLSVRYDAETRHDLDLFFYAGMIAEKRGYHSLSIAYRAAPATVLTIAQVRALNRQSAPPRNHYASDRAVLAYFQPQNARRVHSNV